MNKLITILYIALSGFVNGQYLSFSNNTAVAYTATVSPNFKLETKKDLDSLVYKTNFEIVNLIFGPNDIKFYDFKIVNNCQWYHQDTTMIYSNFKDFKNQSNYISFNFKTNDRQTNELYTEYIYLDVNPDATAGQYIHVSMWYINKKKGLVGGTLTARANVKDLQINVK